MDQSFGNPAQSLENVHLDNGWHVDKLIKPKPEDTGGHFSVGYIVSRNDTKAYLKALDLTDAFSQEDFITALEKLTSAFNFERNLLYKCKRSRLSKIVTPIDDGKYNFPGQPSFMSVYYIIFELADGNLRNHIEAMKKFDLAWILRSLHNTAVGIEQLHKNGIAHQDLKPSNVLIFNTTSKVSDLGRSSDKNNPSFNDNLIIAGDRTYAPIELFYGINDITTFSYRYSADLYLIGSLVFFYFLNLNLQQIIWHFLKTNNYLSDLTKNDFYADLPYFQFAFNIALQILDEEISKYSTNLGRELIPIVKMLCNPDPLKRGYIKNVKTEVNQYSLERFISKFDHIAKMAEYGIL